MTWKQEWFDKRLAERKAWTERQVANGVPRSGLLDPALTTISEYYLMGLHKEDTDG